MSGVLPLSGISGLFFDSTFLSYSVKALLLFLSSFPSLGPFFRPLSRNLFIFWSKDRLFCMVFVAVVVIVVVIGILFRLVLFG